jgi:voltage-gated potassium channel
MPFGSLRKSIRRLYGGATPRGIRFRYALLAFDIATALFIIATSFLLCGTSGRAVRSIRCRSP